MPSEDNNRDRLIASVRSKEWSNRSAHSAFSRYSISFSPFRTATESRNNSEGILTNAISIDKCRVAASAGGGSFVGIGVRTKWRVESVVRLNKHPVSKMQVRAMNKRCRRQKIVFMVILLVAFYPST